MALLLSFFVEKRLEGFGFRPLNFSCLNFLAASQRLLKQFVFVPFEELALAGVNVGIHED